jgi:hypothetical protein
MNEKIKELVEHVVGPSRLHGGEFALFGDKDVEKFAELIVRECAKRVDYWESRQGEHTEDLLKHFGIETVDSTLRARSTYYGNNP